MGSYRTAFKCPINLTQAFNKLTLTDVLRLLRDRNLDPNLPEKEGNTGSTTFIKVGHDLTSRISATSSNYKTRKLKTITHIIFRAVTIFQTPECINIENIVVLKFKN